MVCHVSRDIVMALNAKQSQALDGHYIDRNQKRKAPGNRVFSRA